MRYIFDDLKVVCNVIKTRKKWIRKLYYLSQSASRDNSVNFLYLNESLLINTSVIHLIIYIYWFIIKTNIYISFVQTQEFIYMINYFDLIETGSEATYFFYFWMIFSVSKCSPSQIRKCEWWVCGESSAATEYLLLDGGAGVCTS